MTRVTVVRTASSSQLNSLLTQASASATYLSKASASTTYLTQTSASTTYHPLDSDLTALSGLSEGSGLLRRSGSSWFFDTSPYITVAPPGFRNIIINGDFRINQRNYVKHTSLASGAYSFDRWKATSANTSLEFV
jgi:hypothetical protein